MRVKLTRFSTICLSLGLLALSACAPMDSRSGDSLSNAAAESISEEAYVARAFELADTDFLKVTAELQCGNDREKVMAFFADKRRVPPTRIFDNLVYLGLPGVGAYALLTDEGIILIDALNSTEDVKTIIEPGLRELGLDPAAIKHVIVTQGHGDHYGGAKYIANTYGSRIHMSGADWELLETVKQNSPFDDRSRFGAPPERDLTLTDGQNVKLGSTELTVVLTPGHSPATASLIFPVFDNGQRHMAGIWGGTAIPRDIPMIEKYIASTQKFLEVSQNYGVDVEVNGHAFVDDALRRMQQLRANPEQPNPFVIGQERYAKFTKILEACASAALVRAQKTSSTEKKT